MVVYMFVHRKNDFVEGSLLDTDLKIILLDHQIILKIMSNAAKYFRN